MIDAAWAERFAIGFEQDEELRSIFVRELELHMLEDVPGDFPLAGRSGLPRIVMQYWHDPDDIPDDVRACLNSWRRLEEHGFLLHEFCDESALSYISINYGARECAAFMRCRHPAMRCDYFRLCFILKEGGIYVDADDVLISDDWSALFRDERLKVQPLCYDVPSASMVEASNIWSRDLKLEGRIFYANNNPLIGPSGHPLVQSALQRATGILLGGAAHHEIQSTTGPGNLTAVLAAHARDLIVAGRPLDFEIMRSWESVAQTRWELSYRNDGRNWRNMR